MEKNESLPKWKYGRDIPRLATKQELQVFHALNQIRLDGKINMFGATPYISAMFDMDRAEARKLLTLWMDNFDAEGNYDFIIEK